MKTCEEILWRKIGKQIGSTQVKCVCGRKSSASCIRRTNPNENEWMAFLINCPTAEPNTSTAAMNFSSNWISQSKRAFSIVSKCRFIHCIQCRLQTTMNYVVFYVKRVLFRHLPSHMTATRPNWFLFSVSSCGAQPTYRVRRHSCHGEWATKENYWTGFAGSSRRSERSVNHGK